MKLEDAFERVVVINLPFKTDRRQRLEKHMQETGIADPEKVCWERAICGDWTPPPAWWGAGNGAWGCLMSHLRVGQDAVHDQLSSYCVLEDDVIFHARASEMLEGFMKELPKDWGQAYLGGQFLHKEPRQISPWVMRPYNVNRTHAFALSRRIIPRYLQHIMHAPDYFDAKANQKGGVSLNKNGFHIDHQLGRAHEREDWNTYAPTWWIAGQDGGSSNISGRVNSRTWWHWRDRGKALPFVFLKRDTSPAERSKAYRYIHPGYNLVSGTLTDIGLDCELSDEQLLHWLGMIAGEAVELWKLPGFEIPSKHPDLVARVQSLWKPGLIEAEEPKMEAAISYPFNEIGGSTIPWRMNLAKIAQPSLVTL